MCSPVLDRLKQPVRDTILAKMCLTLAHSKWTCNFAPTFQVPPKIDSKPQGCLQVEQKKLLYALGGACTGGLYVYIYIRNYMILHEVLLLKMYNMSKLQQTCSCCSTGTNVLAHQCQGNALDLHWGWSGEAQPSHSLSGRDRKHTNRLVKQKFY